MLAKPTIYADFQKLDDSGRLILSCAESINDIERFKTVLSQGMEVTFYSDDCDDEGKGDAIYVDGTIEYDNEANAWFGLYDRNKFRHASDGRR